MEAMVFLQPNRQPFLPPRLNLRCQTITNKQNATWQCALLRAALQWSKPNREPFATPVDLGMRLLHIVMHPGGAHHKSCAAVVPSSRLYSLKLCF